MNITLEMIERVMEATDADYYQIKEALIAADGDVNSSIEALKNVQEEVTERSMPEEVTGEESPEAEVKAEETEAKAEEAPEDKQEDTAGKETAGEETPREDWTMEEFAEKMIERLKKRVEEGNVERIKISRDGKTILNIPLGLGLLGGIFTIVTIPWAMILGILTAMGLNCKIEIINQDGSHEEM